MRLFILLCLTLVAFAANSVLGRAAIGNAYIDATSFGLLRLGSGAAMLVALCVMRGLPLRQPWKTSLWGGASLTLYMVGFALAYKDLDAGLGALVLFAVVQITMFAWGAVTNQRPGGLQIAGAGMALVGLAYVVWPRDGVSVDLWASFLMGLSGLGWGIYSLLGRGVKLPVVSTALNFVWATALVLPIFLITGGAHVISAPGVVLAVVSGAVTSGLGYALWYAILPVLTAPVAATVQLLVPIIAILGGALFLGEAIGLALVIGTVLILGGIAVVALAPKPAAKRVAEGDANRAAR